MLRGEKNLPTHKLVPRTTDVNGIPTVVYDRVPINRENLPTISLKQPKPITIEEESKAVPTRAMITNHVDLTGEATRWGKFIQPGKKIIFGDTGEVVQDTTPAPLKAIPTTSVTLNQQEQIIANSSRDGMQANAILERIARRLEADSE